VRGWLARTLENGGDVVLAGTFMFSWFSVFMSFVAAAVVAVVLVLIFQVRYIGAVVIVSGLALVGCQIGFAAIEAHHHNSLVASQRFIREVTHDLRSEHFRISYIDDYYKTVVLLVGRSNCQLPPLSVSRAASRHDSTIKWRPVLSTTKGQVGLEATDLQSMAKACSAG